MRGTADCSTTYPFKAQFIPDNKPLTTGGWRVWNVAKQEYHSDTFYPNEGEALAKARALREQQL